MRTRILLGIAGVAILISGCVTRVADKEPITRSVWLEQNWTEEQRQQYHHWSQGTKTFLVPYKWFISLEQPNVSVVEQPLFADDEYLKGFGFIPSPKSKYNPDGLPVGFARDPNWRDPNTGEKKDLIGLTCAACHTGHLEYKGTDVRIDGSSAITNVVATLESLALALVNTELAPIRFERFANRVLGEKHSEKEKWALKVEVLEAIKEFKFIQGQENRFKKQNVMEGYARTDALARIGNEVFSLQMNRPENFAAVNAPVNFPHIWDTSWFDWVQYNGSIEQPMVRNAGEALGVVAKANLTDPKKELYKSSVGFDGLIGIEELLAGTTPPTKAKKFTGLRAPKWPEDIFGKIDKNQASKGKSLYKKHCQSCHRPPVDSDDFWNEEFWTTPNDTGHSFYKVVMVDIDQLGTDPMQASNLANRNVVTSDFLGIEPKNFGLALGVLVENVVTKYYDDNNIPAAERERLNGFRPNGIRAPMQYKARPLDGIWATPPYLHNGSVPNLYALLSPVNERPKTFYLGSREFDPKNVGYEYAEVEGATLLDTTIKGNWNTGHEFKDGSGKGIIGPALSKDERRALLEYLKTL